MSLLEASPTTSRRSARSARAAHPPPRVGSQTPRICVVPPYVRTYGGEVVDFMAQIGRPLDPWQADIVRCAFGVQDDGLWAAYELMILLSRQNGKGGVTEAIELAGLFLFHEPLILHSAHQFKTSTAAFRRLQDIIEGSDWLSRRVKMISRSKGDESIELTKAAGGGRLQFVARTLGSGRGLTGSTNVFDEAYALTVGQYAAQTPTLATIPNPRIVYTSTPPDEDTGPMPEDAMLPSVRARGHAGEDRVACFEWSPPDGFDVEDVDLWYGCNPALGIRISEWFLGKQLKAFTAAGKPWKFATEHLGLWPPGAADKWLVIAERDWFAACDPQSRTVGTVAFAVEMSLDRLWTVIAVAGVRADGKRHVEIVESRLGTGWVVERVKELRDTHRPYAIAVSPTSPAGSLIGDLEAADIDIARMSERDVAQAAGAFWDAICGPVPDDPADPDNPRNVRHIGQGVLTTAVSGAVRRNQGNAWTWDRRSASMDVSPLVAASNALHTYVTHATKGVLTGPLMV